MCTKCLFHCSLIFNYFHPRVFCPFINEIRKLRMLTSDTHFVFYETRPQSYSIYLYIVLFLHRWNWLQKKKSIKRMQGTLGSLQQRSECDCVLTTNQKPPPTPKPKCFKKVKYFFTEHLELYEVWSSNLADHVTSFWIWSALECDCRTLWSCSHSSLKKSLSIPRGVQWRPGGCSRTFLCWTFQ